MYERKGEKKGKYPVANGYHLIRNYFVGILKSEIHEVPIMHIFL